MFGNCYLCLGLFFSLVKCQPFTCMSVFCYVIFLVLSQSCMSQRWLFWKSQTKGESKQNTSTSITNRKQLPFFCLSYLLEHFPAMCSWVTNGGPQNCLCSFLLLWKQVSWPLFRNPFSPKLCPFMLSFRRSVLLYKRTRGKMFLSMLRLDHVYRFPRSVWYPGL